MNQLFLREVLSFSLLYEGQLCAANNGGNDTGLSLAEKLSTRYRNEKARKTDEVAERLDGDR